ncbi:Galactose/methyl galactoside import ATP-binding protein MglA [Neomoorella glycerini]|uniref:Galactose/methyl galactoside import ATP-binding protein MglA n=1 Tax=Neomoorella glycerini TaxID=55779 RepID=A0A6I5ZRT7_9FIRM|nr:ABC transporter ATP-binding protein [Moorella glycerini]QGP92277.1 Galactose/methyl galactoside import ATP-binding protein MglA [Moorella glycerini]
MAALLELKGICKYFPGVRANDQVNLEILPGEIHALLGENGAGKTTLMNCVYGLYTPDAGQIFWQGREIKIRSIRDAINIGIGMVHQHFMLVHNLTVLENIMLGLLSSREPFLDKKRVATEVTELMQAYGLQVELDAQIWQLPVGVQQRVEILKALYRKARLLILDEPTAVLTPSEVKELFRVLRQLTDRGQAVILITHKLDEVMAVAHRVTVMRDGKVVQTLPTSGTDKQTLARLMVGRDITLEMTRTPARTGEVILEVEDLHALNNRGLPALRGVSFRIHRGEILGIAGVAGNGQTELAEVLTGLRPATAGRVRLKGRDVTNYPPRALYNLNLAHIPEDRQRLGLILDFSLEENTMLGVYYRRPYARGIKVQHDIIKNHAARLIKEYDVRAPGISTRARFLSGGNQQKLILARELDRQPDLLIAVQPTRGLDIGATEFVQQQILAHRERGAAILYISTELEEIMKLSDIIAVFYEGQIVGLLEGDQVDLETIGLMMAGSRRPA